MAHTNASIPRYGDTMQRLEIAKLEAELKFWKDEAAWLKRELENVPEALIQHGQIHFADWKGQNIKAVLPPPTPTAGDV